MPVGRSESPAEPGEEAQHGAGVSHLGRCCVLPRRALAESQEAGRLAFNSLSLTTLNAGAVRVTVPFRERREQQRLREVERSPRVTEPSGAEFELKPCFRGLCPSSASWDQKQRLQASFPGVPGPVQPPAPCSRLSPPSSLPCGSLGLATPTAVLRALPGCAHAGGSSRVHP